MMVTDPIVLTVLWTQKPTLNLLVEGTFSLMLLHKFEARHGALRTALLTIMALIVLAIFGYAVQKEYLLAALGDVGFTFVSLGLAHADVLVNWDFPTLLKIVTSDLIIFPAVMAIWNGGETILVCLGAYAVTFCLALPFVPLVPRTIGSKANNLGSPDIFHRGAFWFMWTVNYLLWSRLWWAILFGAGR